MESEDCEWVGMNVMSTVFEKEGDSVFLVYLNILISEQGRAVANGLLSHCDSHSAQKPLFSCLFIFLMTFNFFSKCFLAFRKHFH